MVQVNLHKMDTGEYRLVQFTRFWQKNLTLTEHEYIETVTRSGKAKLEDGKLITHQCSQHPGQQGNPMWFKAEVQPHDIMCDEFLWCTAIQVKEEARKLREAGRIGHLIGMTISMVRSFNSNLKCA